MNTQMLNKINTIVYRKDVNCVAKMKVPPRNSLALYQVTHTILARKR